MVKVNNIEKNRYSNNKKFSLLNESSGLIPLASNPGIGAWYSRICGEGSAPLVRHLGVEMAGRFFLFFSFFCFPWSYVPSLQAGVLK
jgi:hypothetical protein